MDELDEIEDTLNRCGLPSMDENQFISILMNIDWMDTRIANLKAAAREAQNTLLFLHRALYDDMPTMYLQKIDACLGNIDRVLGDS